MSTQSPSAGDKVATAANPKVKKDPQRPPDEQFWVRYSPHHEAPLSGVGSLLLHVLLLVAIVLIALGVAKLEKGKQRIDLSVGVREGNSPGSGNNGGSGDNTNKSLVEDAGTNPMPTTPTTPDPMPPSDIEAAKSKDPEVDPNLRLISPTQAREAVKKLGAVGEMLSKTLAKSGGPAGVGPDSPDGKGGKDTGPGGSVDGGPGSGKTRSERMNRWTMTFDTRSGVDYVNQLHALGAFLAIPTPGTDPPEYELIRDLRARPPRMLKEDLSQIKRVFWVDDKADSVRSLMTALGLNLPVNHFVAFMPPELEAKLLKLERSYRNRQEHEIEETLFRVKKVGSTGYEPVVVSQTPKR